MDWIPVRSNADVEKLVAASQGKPQVLFKHSTRCNISAMAKARFERALSAAPLPADLHLLRVVEDRPVSQFAADFLRVHHESPQLIVLHHQEVVLDQSHLDITLEEVQEVLGEVRK